ncbi:M15 family metallopeptidase [Mucilaginibacter myungsuensis]|uniref:D-alanyl-D-alanine dipeptidase n=1 Tax=Mucilaginibacter myungsuensis TaxID=649104 RepID=A0A929PYI0_9SPHI|nr:M15 family metallopeptidase [Mucilaginibacter myungsuensis]MBE9663352.1 M15 family metallopeptidase [Mucilaginibacter myungsuensis]MDN3600087.1 M15 family metallopeptidase [Mucilaginibacter myungsuensis]
MKKSLFILLACCCVFISSAQQYPYVLSASAYAQQIKTHPEKKLVEITKAIPSIKLDVRYATKNNFMGRVMYKQARAFARAPVAEALKKIQTELALKGLGLKIFDGYRPYAVTVDFFKFAKDTNFVANPKYGSKHNRGCAVDLTIIDLKTGKELEMPTPYDCFSRKAGALYAKLPAIQIQNRALLRSVMEKHGFMQLPSEWWHFDFKGWKAFELLNVPFEKL